MQHGDIYHPHHDCDTAGGALGASNRVNKAAAYHYTNTPPRETDGSLGGMMTHPIG
jgi:hypothetical protein